MKRRLIELSFLVSLLLSEVYSSGREVKLNEGVKKKEYFTKRSEVNIEGEIGEKDFEKAWNDAIKKKDFDLCERILFEDYKNAIRERNIWMKIISEEIGEMYEELKKHRDLKRFEERVIKDGIRFKKEFIIKEDSNSIESALNCYLIIKKYDEVENCMIKWIKRKANTYLTIRRIMDYYNELKSKKISLERFEKEARRVGMIYTKINPYGTDTIKAAWIIFYNLKDKEGMKETIEAGYSWGYRKKILKEWAKELKGIK